VFQIFNARHLEINVFVQKLVSVLTDGAAVTVGENVGLIMFLLHDVLFPTFLQLPLYKYLSLTNSAYSKTSIDFKHKTPK
jgi:hypothetical protein